MNFKLKTFDINNVPIHASICILSKENSQYKSYLIRKLFREIKGKVLYNKECCEVEKLNDFSKELIQDIKRINSLDLYYSEKNKLINNSLINLDLDKIEKINSLVSLRFCLRNNRYCRIFLLINVNNMADIHPIITTNFYYIIIEKEIYLNKLRFIYDNYCQIIESFDIFKEIMDNLSYNEYLVINNFVGFSSKLLENNIFIYRIIDYKKWKIIGNKMNKVIQEHLGNPCLKGVRRRLLEEYDNLINFNQK